MSTEINFDSAEVEPLGEYTPIPIDEYMAMITASERKKVADKPQNEYIQLVFDIVEGEYTGRKVFERLNIVNDNDTAVKIAQQKLSAICRIFSIVKLINTDQLHDKPIIISVGIRPAKGNFGESNEIKGYKRKDGASIKDILNEGSRAPVAKAAPAASGEKKLKPWQKKN